jgi:hypothetical protein
MGVLTLFLAGRSTPLVILGGAMLLTGLVASFHPR